VRDLDGAGGRSKRMQSNRPSTASRRLAALKPVFSVMGKDRQEAVFITAGNASQLSDWRSASLLD